MKRLGLAALVVALGAAPAAFAQNVQDRTDPQNPKDVTQASPADQGATDSMPGQTGANDRKADQSKKKMDKKSMHKKEHKGMDSSTSGSNQNASGGTQK
jgi:opacity protein-like surface antigen